MATWHITTAIPPTARAGDTSILTATLSRIYPHGTCAYLRGMAGQVIEAIAADNSDHVDTSTARIGLHVWRSDEPNVVALESDLTSSALERDTPFPCPISCSLGYRGSGVVDLLYADGGVVYIRESRDQTRTFSAAQTVVGSTSDPYLLVTHAHDWMTGLLVAMCYRDSTASWYAVAGQLGADGITWTFQSPVLVVAADKNGGGSLIANRPVLAGPEVWRFAYTAGSVISLITCRSMPGSGAGTWSAPQTIHDATGAYSLPSLYLDERDGMLGVTIYQFDAAIPGMFFLTGTLGTDGVTWTFGSPQRMTDPAHGPYYSGANQTDGTQGALYRRDDGVFDIFYPNGKSASQYFSTWFARALHGDGTNGPWAGGP